MEPKPSPMSRIQRHIANHDLDKLTAGQLKELLRILSLPQGRRQKGGKWGYLTNDERRREIRRKVSNAAYAHDWNLERFADALDEILETTEASGR